VRRASLRVFESAAAYYANFRRAIGLSPGDYRALPQGDEIMLALPPGYRADSVLRIQGRDAESPCERVEGTRIVKALDADGTRALLHMHLDGARVYCRIEGVHARCPAIRSCTRPTRSPCACSASSRSRWRAARVAMTSRARAASHARPGLRVTLMGDAFEALCWAIIGSR
jgi:hypothetical protein